MTRFAHSVSALRSSEIRDLMSLATSPGIISFSGGMPGNELFPLDMIDNVYQSLTEKEKQALLLQLSIAKFILLKDTENPLEIQSYIPARKAVEISLLDILEATGEHLNCNRPITEQFYAQYGRAAQKLGIINQIARIYLKEITLTDL